MNEFLLLICLLFDFKIVSHFSLLVPALLPKKKHGAKHQNDRFHKYLSNQIGKMSSGIITIPHHTVFP